jgi:hypothetical protein
MELPGIVEDGFAPVEADGAVLDTVDLLGSLNRIADITGRHADSPPTLSLTTFLGGSSTIVISVPGGDERVHVETIKHTGIIYLQIIEEMEGEGDKSVLSFRLRAAEGTPSIEWLRQIGPLTFAGYPDPMAGRVDLVLSITRSDGRVSDYELQLDAPSARLSQPWPSGDHGFQDGKAPLFGDQMNERSRSHEALERALGFR